jgi:hypothetical protein
VFKRAATPPYSKPEHFWTFWRRDEHLFCLGIRTTVRPACSPVGLGLLIRLFPSGFPTKILHIFLFSHIHAACTVYLISFICSHRSYMVRITHHGTPNYPIFSVFLVLPFGPQISPSESYSRITVAYVLPII